MLHDPLRRLAIPFRRNRALFPLAGHQACQHRREDALVCSVCLVCLVYLVEPDQLDELNKPDRPHQRNADRPSVYQMRDDLIVADFDAHHARFNDLRRSAHANPIVSLPRVSTKKVSVTHRLTLGWPRPLDGEADSPTVPAPGLPKA